MPIVECNAKSEFCTPLGGGPRFSPHALTPLAWKSDWANEKTGCESAIRQGSAYFGPAHMQLPKGKDLTRSLILRDLRFPETN